MPGTPIPWPFISYLGPGRRARRIVLHRTWIGRQIYAIGKNAAASRYSGVRVAPLKLALFVLSGTVAALAGVILTARLSPAPAPTSARA